MWHERRALWMVITHFFLIWPDCNEGYDEDISSNTHSPSTEECITENGSENKSVSPSSPIGYDWKMPIGIACGILLIILSIIGIVLLFKFFSRKQSTANSDTECPQPISSSKDVPMDDISQLYAKVQKTKSKENCSSDAEDLNYSSVKFSKEAATSEAEQSSTEYSEIKCP